MVRLVTVQFDYNESDEYKTLLEVLEYSVDKNMPSAELNMVCAPAPPWVNKRLPIEFTTNTKKLDYWVKIMDESKDGERLIFMDCDMIVVGNIEEAFEVKDFDVAFTRRDKVKYPMNGGVFFVNVNDKSRSFIRLWREVNNKMFNDHAFHRPWRVKYAGMNQAAFGYIYEEVNHGVNIQEFLCSEYNVCNEDWEFIGADSKVIHIKSRLRKACIAYSRGRDYRELSRGIEKPFQMWCKLYEEMRIKKEKYSGINFIIAGFDFDGNNTFKVLADVLEYSILENMQSPKISRITPKTPDQNGNARAFVANTLKLQLWVHELEQLGEGEYAVAMDADMLVVDDISSVFELDFDIAYTVRTRSTFPVNGGILFIKINKNSLKFMREYLRINIKMFNEPGFHQEWKRKYAGMNQSAFGYMLEKYESDIKLMKLRCSEYNVCNEDWAGMNGDEKILHIKSGLRRALLENKPCPEGMDKPYKIWKDYYERYEKPSLGCTS